MQVPERIKRPRFKALIELCEEYIKEQSESEEERRETGNAEWIEKHYPEAIYIAALEAIYGENILAWIDELDEISEEYYEKNGLL